MESDLSILEKELMNIKETSKYKVNCSNIVESKEKTSIEGFNSEISIPINSFFRKSIIKCEY